MSDAEKLDEVMKFVSSRRREYANLAALSVKKGLEIIKLSAECRELAYFDVMKAIERIRTEKRKP